jgi:hypothetical protein
MQKQMQMQKQKKPALVLPVAMLRKWSKPKVKRRIQSRSATVLRRQFKKGIRHSQRAGTGAKQKDATN